MIYKTYLYFIIYNFKYKYNFVPFTWCLPFTLSLLNFVITILLWFYAFNFQILHISDIMQFFPFCI